MPQPIPLSELSRRIQVQSQLAARVATAIEIVFDPASDLWARITRVLELVADEFSLADLALYAGRRGRWDRLCQLRTSTVGDEVLSEALDSQQWVLGQGLAVGALDPSDRRGEVLVAWAPNKLDPTSLDAAAALVAYALRLARDLRDKDRRIRRQQAILEIAAQWNQAQELAPLLEQMAETSTSLIQAERASIFLWDKPHRQLIGRPALGVENNELRIPDSTGIVGQVVQSGEVRRVDLDIREQQEIDRQVDERLGFETRTLLCAPLEVDGEILGAFEMINKIGGNFDSQDEADLVELAGHAAIALANTQHLEKLIRKQERLVDQAASEVRLIGECEAIQNLKESIQRVAATDLSVLILGENGTGKEVAGQLLHYLSPRRQEPLVAVNCAAITESLLESELFGHEKGAFTDANETRPGKFEVASGGTLFLDEIGDMSLSGQAKLLRVLEEKVVVRVGGSTPIPADVRIIAATNQNLGELVRAKKFREDLFFRLTVVTVEMPPLRDRGDDVLLLAEHFLKTFCRQARREVPQFTAAARKALSRHAWPGNVRELRNMMERLAYLTQSEKIDEADLAFPMTGPLREQQEDPFPLDLNLSDATREFQIQFIEKQIAATRGNMTDAAKRLGLHRSNLYRKMRQLGMELDEDR